MATINHQTATYEELLEDARLKSISGNCYAAVVEITVYLSDRRRMTVATGPDKFVSHQRRGEFRGIMAQFHRGRPAYRPVAPKAAETVPADSQDDDRLPF